MTSLRPLGFAAVFSVAAGTESGAARGEPVREPAREPAPTGAQSTPVEVSRET